MSSTAEYLLYLVKRDCEMSDLQEIINDLQLTQEARENVPF